MTIGCGAKLTVNDGIASAQAEVPEVVSMTGPESNLAQVDVSYLNMPTCDKLFEAGLGEPGTFTFEFNYDATTLARMDTLRGVDKTWVKYYPDGSTETFAGFIKNQPHGDISGAGDKVLVKVEVQVSGSVDFDVVGGSSLMAWLTAEEMNA